MAKKDYECEYLFVRKADGDHVPSLIPDEHTEDRDFRWQAQERGSAPLVFLNAWAEENKRHRISAVLPNVLFDGSDIVVHTAIYDKLIGLDLPGVHMHPSVYVDDNGVRHEDFWYVTFPTLFDCWDRETSKVGKTVLDLGDEKLYQVFTYRLDRKRLDQTPLRDRLLFKMGGTINTFVVCHESLRSLFSGEDAGVWLQSIADY